jgi:hypothetical protein
MELNDCGCCEGISVETPARLENRPGLAAIAYRIGSHPQFKATLLARLSGLRQPALDALTTRDDGDFTIAFLDACALVGDILTFYQERIANEAYLRTAIERVSILELARLIDYQLRPGVAASTYLAFTLDDAPGAVGQALSLGTTAQTSAAPLPPVLIEAGAKVQSVPGPGEQAQTFETIEAIAARPAWNAIGPRLTRPQDDAAFMGTAVILRGTATGVKVGDMLLVEVGNSRTLKTAQRVTADDGENTTRVDFISVPAPLPEFDEPSPVADGSINDFPNKVELDDNVVQDIVARTWKAEDLLALATMQGWSEGALVSAIARKTSTLPAVKVYVFRQQAGIFGHNAPFYKSIIKPDGTPLYPHDWDTNGFEIWKDSLSTANTPGYYAGADLYLERSLTGLARDEYVVLQIANSAIAPAIHRVAAVSEASLTGFGISGKVTALDLKKLNGDPVGNNGTDKPGDYKVRNTTVFLQPALLELAELPIIDPILGDTVTLDRTYLGLKAGQRVVLTGDRDDLQGAVSSELRSLKDVYVVGGFTVVTFDRPLDFRYKRQLPSKLGDTERKTVAINANVAAATHGDTVHEVMGSGDANLEFQRFTLRQPPLTYVSAATPSGGASTLEVRVNDALWREVPSFVGQRPDARIYITRLDDEGRTTVIFGDGRTGARLPTGQENVRAKYRKGVGLGGVLDADRLTQLMTRPHGVKGVTNPVAATGAADPEPRDDARRNAPLTIVTLGRIVSLEDYEAFARAFSGIDKALATWTWFGEKRGVFVTIAGAGGADVKEESALYAHLLEAMKTSGDPTVPLVVKSYQPRLFRVAASLKIDPTLLPEKVRAAIETTLRDTFSFARRDFGHPVHFSDVVGAIQNVPGVVFVDVNEFHRSDLPAGPVPEAHIAAAVPRAGSGQAQVLPAEMLTLDPRPLALEVHK